MRYNALILMALLASPLATLHGADTEIAAESVTPKKSLPLDGEVFLVDGHTAFVIPPKHVVPGQATPWVWYAPTLPNLPGKAEEWMFTRFTDAGIAIAGIDVGESYGSPAGRALYTKLYMELTQRRGFSIKPVMLGRSRGGLMTLSWAVENPGRVGGFAGIYPVCNLASYPGVSKAAEAYELTAEALQAQLSEHNPVDRVGKLARADVPLFAIHGDEDSVVPLEANSGLLRERYVFHGGPMKLVIPSGQGHNMWPGFFECEELVDFVKANALAIEFTALNLTSPLDYQVIQRSSSDQTIVPIAGSLDEQLAAATAIEARLIQNQEPSAWQPLDATFRETQFESSISLPAGGWHRLEVRALANEEVIGEAVVEHVGIGELFVVAGQSNSANHGEERQSPKSDRVVAFDGKQWQIASDPQPGASGNGGSFMPPFGDALVERFNVPVGFIPCGIGATSVREWLPTGSTFPSPPTIESRVRKLSTGDWASNGEAFKMFVSRMKSLGPLGFRAVLWHQGESDANQKDPSRTLPGPLYREFLEKVIRESRQEIGWNAPWFVAQVSYHVPGDESSDDIRDAQASLWRDRIAQEGPDSDALKGELRERDGQGVHFSGKGLREHASAWADKVGPWVEQQLDIP